MSVNISVSDIAVYSYDELMDATEGKSSVMHLGSGGFGDVYLGKLHSTMMAIKFFKNVCIPVIFACVFIHINLIYFRAIISPNQSPTLGEN